MEKLKNIAIKYKDALLYLTFGVLTTLVDFLVYTPLHIWSKFPDFVCDMFSCSVAVVFAFLTNKPFVFKSKDWSAKTVIPEFGKFVSSRAVSVLIEILFIAYTADYLGWNGIAMKIIAGGIVIVFNYVASRFFVFKRV